MWQKIYDGNFSLDQVTGRIKKYGLENSILTTMLKKHFYLRVFREPSSHQRLHFWYF